MPLQLYTKNSHLAIQDFRKNVRDQINSIPEVKLRGQTNEQIVDEILASQRLPLLVLDVSKLKCVGHSEGRIIYSIPCNGDVNILEYEQPSSHNKLFGVNIATFEGQGEVRLEVQNMTDKPEEQVEIADKQVNEFAEHLNTIATDVSSFFTGATNDARGELMQKVDIHRKVMLDQDEAVKKSKFK